MKSEYIKRKHGTCSMQTFQQPRLECWGKPESHEHTVAMEEAFHENKVWSLRALLAKIGSLHIAYYRIIIQILKMWKPESHDVTSGQLEIRIMYSTYNLQEPAEQIFAVNKKSTWSGFRYSRSMVKFTASCRKGIRSDKKMTSSWGEIEFGGGVK